MLEPCCAVLIVQSCQQYCSALHVILPQRFCSILLITIYNVGGLAQHFFKHVMNNIAKSCAFYAFSLHGKFFEMKRSYD